MSAVKAYRYYRLALICAEELSDGLGHEKEERYFSVKVYARWYEAIEKAVVIWLYHLGIRVGAGMLGGRVRGYHEAFLYTLSHPDNPFFEVFNRPDLLACLHEARKIRNGWRHGWLLVLELGAGWEIMAGNIDYVIDALEDAFTTFSEIQVGIR